MRRVGGATDLGDGRQDASANALLDGLARSRGVISDGATAMAHRDVAFAALRVLGHLAESGVAGTDCLAFRCDNDLPSVVTLLALLAGGRSFVLLPAAAPDGGMQADAPERFCRYLLRGEWRHGAASDTAPGRPEIWPVILADPLWQAGLASAPGRVFIRTSGSTGGSKLVQHRCSRLVEAAFHCADRLGLGPADRIALPVPVAHMFGLGAALLPAVLSGASLDLQRHANVLRFLARERCFAPTVAFMTPSFGDALTRLRKAPRAYRLTVMAGDHLPAALFDRFERLHGCLVNLYGSSELGVIAAGDPRDPARLRRDAVGRLMPGVVLKPVVPDAGDDEFATPAVPLCFRHAYGFENYADYCGAAVRGPDGLHASGEHFRSSDVGRMVDGYLTVAGRGDDMVNRDGLLVACSEVTAAVRALPGIADALVLGGAMARRGRALIAFCVAGPGGIQPADALRHACLDVLPSRAVPDRFLFVPALPRLPGGKVDRAGLRRLPIVTEALAGAELR